VNWYPVSLNNTQFCSFYNYSQTGDEMQGLQSQTRAQRQDDFRGVSITPKIQHPCSTGFKTKQANKIVWITHSLTHSLVYSPYLGRLISFPSHVAPPLNKFVDNVKSWNKAQFYQNKGPHTHTHKQTRQASSTAHGILWAVN
jgi:hypothetical protein